MFPHRGFTMSKNWCVILTHMWGSNMLSYISSVDSLLTIDVLITRRAHNNAIQRNALNPLMEENIQATLVY
jgi:hypothetical protein